MPQSYLHNSSGASLALPPGSAGFASYDGSSRQSCGSLAKDVEDFLREQVQPGVAAAPSALANDVLRCVRDQQRKPFEITPQLEAWLLEAADQPATPLTKADFDGIR